LSKNKYKNENILQVSRRRFVIEEKEEHNNNNKKKDKKSKLGSQKKSQHEPNENTNIREKKTNL